jgi:membrane-associated PAP2 superfamily phosphatase
MPRAAAPSRLSPLQLVGWTIVIGLLMVAWDLLGQDLALAHWFGSRTGFVYRDQWLFSGVLHQGARRLAWTLQFGLVLAIWWPMGPLRTLPRRERVHLLIGTLVTILAIWLLKSRSLTSCPWELAEFGGQAVYVSHWNWGIADGGEGLCFPAGHASAGFAFLTGYFWLRVRAPKAALVWLAVTLVAGSTIGLAQQVRGAHYMSHTLWTGWLSWVIAAASYLLLEHTPVRRWFGSVARPGS